MNKFYHAIDLKEDRCMGCTTCMKNCPSGAVRLHTGKAMIIEEFCTDCGECARVCKVHAIRTRRESLEDLDRYQYKVALPDPSFYSQFNSLKDINIVLTALLMSGFDDVFEVSSAAEMVSALTSEYIGEHKDKWPLISTNCPTVVREIRIQFPKLVDHLLPILPPHQVAGKIARQKAMKLTGLPADQIGIIYLSPCPAKISYQESPLGIEESYIDTAIAIKDIYPVVLSHMKEAAAQVKDLQLSSRIGVSWGVCGGEAKGSQSDNYLYADGMNNIIQVLEGLEDEKMNPELNFIELSACPGGCVGGILQVENIHAARAKMKYLNVFMKKTNLLDAKNRLKKSGEDIHWTGEVQYENVKSLGENFIENLQALEQADQIIEKLPMIDCGFCGAPTCRTFARDVVMGKMPMEACLYLADEEEILRRIRRIKEIHNARK